MTFAGLADRPAMCEELPYARRVIWRLLTVALHEHVPSLGMSKTVE